MHVKLPTRFNDGKIIPVSYFVELEKKFVKEYGGYTRVMPPSRGEWKDRGGKVYLDLTLTYEVFIDKSRFEKTVEQKLGVLIEVLKERLGQKAIACYYLDVRATRF